MTRHDVESAVAEAQRFIARAKTLLNGTSDYRTDDAWKPQPWSGEPSKLSGAVKRASMDLTRALANMRGRAR